VLYVASLHATKINAAHVGSVMIKCFSRTFDLIANSLTTFSELPASCRPKSGTGVLVDLTGNARWRPFAASLIKFVSKCLTEGTLYVEGLLDISFVTAACSLLCYGDTDLHMVGCGWLTVVNLFVSTIIYWYWILLIELDSMVPCCQTNQQQPLMCT
jgi:serine/threonine-protein kinase ATR